MDPCADSAHLDVMKAIYLYTAGALAVTFSLAACVSSPELPPAPPVVVAPTPTPTPAPPPPPPVVQEPVYDSYLDAPQTPGTWTYNNDRTGQMAVYGTDGRPPEFIVRCTGQGTALLRATTEFPTASRAMNIITETVSRNLTADPLPTADPLAARMVAVSLDSRDPLLDAMAITKGRFAVGVEGERTLYLPAWVEISRVIEDCR